MSEFNEARHEEEVAREQAKPLTQTDGELFKGRFLRLEARVLNTERAIIAIQPQLEGVAGVAVRADQLAHAHQPFVDRMARTQASEDSRGVSGRAIVTLMRWAQTLATADCDIVEVQTTHDEREDIRQALANVTLAMGYVDFKVVRDE